MTTSDPTTEETITKVAKASPANADDLIEPRPIQVLSSLPRSHNRWPWMRIGLLAVALQVASPIVAQQAKSNQTPANSIAGETVWITVGGLKLKTRIYKNQALRSNPILIVILHGDSPFGPPSYQYRFARKAAEQLENTITVAILRPGYTDDVGDHSDGERGLTTGDNYTPQVIDAISKVIEQLKGKFHPRATVLVGHSGGAAITGDILGRWPSEVNAALMVSCPCELREWRKHMLELQGADIWKKPVDSLSPFKLADRVRPSVRISLVVGQDDPIAPPEFTRKYADALRHRGVEPHVTVLPMLKHDILLEPAVLQQLRSLIDSFSHPRARSQ